MNEWLQACLGEALIIRASNTPIEKLAPRKISGSFIEHSRASSIILSSGVS